MQSIISDFLINAMCYIEAFDRLWQLVYFTMRLTFGRNFEHWKLVILVNSSFPLRLPKPYKGRDEQFLSNWPSKLQPTERLYTLIKHTVSTNPSARYITLYLQRKSFKSRNFYWAPVFGCAPARDCKSVLWNLYWKYWSMATWLFVVIVPTNQHIRWLP